MPAIFPTSATDDLADVNATTGGATTFYSRVVTLLNTMFGTSNPFGTAATLDAGTAEGNIPVLDVNGLLPSARLPGATAQTPGAVTLAASLASTGALDVVTPAQVRGAVSGITQGLTANAFNITQLALNTTFTTPAAGFLIGSSGGAGGAGTVSSAGVGPGAASNGENLVIRYGAATPTAFSSSTPALIAPGGGRHTAQGRVVSFASFTILQIDAAATAANRAPKFAYYNLQRGAPGGRGGFRTSLARDRRFAIDGQPGALLVALFDRAGIHIRMTSDGTGGNGGNAGTGGADGNAGGNGFALFMRIE